MWRDLTIFWIWGNFGLFFRFFPQSGTLCATLLATQNEALAPQNEALATQNEALAIQNEALPIQNEALATQN